MNLFPAIFIGIILVLGLTFAVNIFGSMETEYNMTGDQYEEEFNATTELTHVGITLWQVVAMFFALAMIAFMLYKFAF